MIVVGLTGSIATGKSTVSRMLRLMQIPVFDADACVHTLFKKEEVITAIKKIFPLAVENAVVNRKTLGEIVFKDTKKLKQLEAILHPKVRQAEIAFIKRNQMQKRRLVVLDVALLFESKADILCDEIWVTYCSDFIQRQRIMRRAGMTHEKCESILAKQMPQKEKITQADKCLPTGIGKAFTIRQLKTYLREY